MLSLNSEMILKTKIRLFLKFKANYKNYLQGSGGYLQGSGGYLPPRKHQKMLENWSFSFKKIACGVPF